MSEPLPTFRSVFPIFFCEPGQAPLSPEWVQSSILPRPAKVQVHIEGPNRDQFSSMTSPLLTAVRPETIFVPTPHGGGPTPAITRHLRPQSIPGGSTTYVVSGTAGAGESLTVEAGGYFEIQVQGNPAPSTVVQGENRFTAYVAVTGMYTDPAEDWPRIDLGLVLNVVRIVSGPVSFGTPPQTGSLFGPGDSASFAAGGETVNVQWEVWADLYPPEPEDYPIQHALGTFDGRATGIVSADGFMYMSLPCLLVIWEPTQIPDLPVENFQIFATGALGAVYYAPSTSGEFTLPQSFFNGSINSPSPSNPFHYEITANPPIVSG